MPVTGFVSLSVDYRKPILKLSGSPSPADGILKDAACLGANHGRKDSEKPSFQEQQWSQICAKGFPANLSLHHLIAKSTSFANLATFLRCSGTVKALPHGRRLHAHICISGYDIDRYLANCLVEMYANSGQVEDAQAVFDSIRSPNLYSWNMLIKTYGQNGNLDAATGTFERMPCRDIVSRNAMITVFAQNGHDKEALDLFHLMFSNYVKPDIVTFVCALEACASLANLDKGEKVHTAVVYDGCEQNVVVGTALIHMYGKCGNICDAYSVFGRIPHRDIVCWTAMSAAFTQNGYCKEALNLFHWMQLESFKPNIISFACVLDACASLAGVEEGKKIHAAFVDNACKQDVFVGNALINMYGKCKSLPDAQRVFSSMVFRDVVSWNAMIAIFAQNGHGKEALDLFSQMQIEAIIADRVTFVCVVEACASEAALQEGKKLHVAVFASGYNPDTIVGNTLINMYGKCQSLDFARSVFDSLADQDVVSWNTLITAFNQNGDGKEVLNLFYQMQFEGVTPNGITLVCVLDRFADIAVLIAGKVAHAAIVNSRYEQDVTVGNSLINMYGKCGVLCHARSVFDRMPSRDVVSWNAMIAAFAQNGHEMDALDLFDEMQLEGIKPNDVTFICVLCACSHAGKVIDGRCVFDCMNRYYGLRQTDDHIVCMIDLLGRAGHLDEAEELIKKLSLPNVAVAWWCLLVACRIHCDVVRGARAAQHCFKIDPENAASYVMLSNIYGAASKLDDVVNVRAIPESNKHSR